MFTFILLFEIIFVNALCFRVSSIKHFLQGIEIASDIKKESMQSHNDKNISRNSREMTIIVSFCDLIVSSQLKTLDLTDVPKILRFHLYDKLGCFRGLRSLILGSGTGGWSNMYIEKFSSGVLNMKHLVKFSLCYDCTDSIIKLLTRNCKASLMIVDVEMSMQVTDASAELLSVCK